MAKKAPATETKQQYRQRLMKLACELMTRGKTLTSICISVEEMPARSTLMDWLREDPKLAEQYARAREIQADYFAEEIVDIADTEPDPQVARVRMDARKWHASKTAPKKYGDKIYQEHSGKVNFATLTDAELEAIAAGQSEA